MAETLAMVAAAAVAKPKRSRGGAILMKCAADDSVWCVCVYVCVCEKMGWD